jgi:hypothetical protein
MYKCTWQVASLKKEKLKKPEIHLEIEALWRMSENSSLNAYLHRPRETDAPSKITFL